MIHDLKKKKFRTDNVFYLRQYTDDMLLFIDNSHRQAIIIKFLLECFESSLGLRINFHKSILVPINLTMEETTTLLESLQCKTQSFPINYLGLP